MMSVFVMEFECPNPKKTSESALVTTAAAVESERFSVVG